MERRKLQSTGGASLTLTLPKAWIRSLKLESKDEVLISARGAVLLVKPADQGKQEIVTTILLDNEPHEWILREMIGAYIAGADVITLRSDRISPSQNHAIRQAVQLLFGFEILEESSRKIVARSMLDDSKFLVSDSTLHIFKIVRRMFDDALVAAKTGDRDLATDIKQRDFEVNKLVHAIQRQAHELMAGKVDGNIIEANYYCNTAVQLERMGDHAVMLADLASSERRDAMQVSAAFAALQERVHRLLKNGEAMVRDLDKTVAHSILDSGTELERLIRKSMRAKQSYDDVLIEYSLDRLRGYLMNIAELTIDYKLMGA